MNLCGFGKETLNYTYKCDKVRMKKKKTQKNNNGHFVPNHK